MPNSLRRLQAPLGYQRAAMEGYCMSSVGLTMLMVIATFAVVLLAATAVCLSRSQPAKY